VVLWESGVVVPRFPVVPEAAWEPVHQRLRRQLEVGVGEEDLLACYGVEDPAAAVSFYAEVYGVEPEAFDWRSLSTEAWSDRRRALATELGRDLPGLSAPESARRAVIPERGDLPTLVLESPRLDAVTGEVVEGALVCLHWSQRETAGSR
jgi:hypothetical protein